MKTTYGQASNFWFWWWELLLGIRTDILLAPSSFCATSDDFFRNFNGAVLCALRDSMPLSRSSNLHFDSTLAEDLFTWVDFLKPNLNHIQNDNGLIFVIDNTLLSFLFETLLTVFVNKWDEYHVLFDCIFFEYMKTLHLHTTFEYVRRFC